MWTHCAGNSADVEDKIIKEEYPPTSSTANDFKDFFKPPAEPEREKADQGFNNGSGYYNNQYYAPYDKNYSFYTHHPAQHAHHSYQQLHYPYHQGSSQYQPQATATSSSGNGQNSAENVNLNVNVNVNVLPSGSSSAQYNASHGQYHLNYNAHCNPHHQYPSAFSNVTNAQYTPPHTPETMSAYYQHHQNFHHHSSYYSHQNHSPEKVLTPPLSPSMGVYPGGPHYVHSSSGMAHHQFYSSHLPAKSKAAMTSATIPPSATIPSTSSLKKSSKQRWQSQESQGRRELGPRGSKLFTLVLRKDATRLTQSRVT